MSTFKNQVILITGAGSGIGRQLALNLAAEGARIGAVDVLEDGLKSLGEELAGKSYEWAVADVADLTALRAAVQSLESRVGPTDVLIANAGIGRETSGLAFRAKDVAAQIQINLIG